jgi:hypothetical protein
MQNQRIVLPILWFCINNYMTNARLQRSNQYLIERFSPWLTHLLTLDLLDSKVSTYTKRYGWNKGAVQRRERSLTDDIAVSSLRYFLEALNYAVHGRRTRKHRYKDVCRVLAIPAFEGAKGNKRRHFHILLGNIPQGKLEDLENIVRRVWASTRWSMPSIDLKELYDEDGAAFYLVKEVGYYSEDAVLWEMASIPHRLVSATA